MRITPDVWGPILWRFLHSYSLNYPVSPTPLDKYKASQYYAGIPRFIPCPTCSHHFQQLLEATPPVTDSRAALAEWVYDAHNTVNSRIGKPHFTPEQFIKMYSPTIKDNQPIPNITATLTGAVVSGVYHGLF